jgi:hypothetical protein
MDVEAWVDEALAKNDFTGARQTVFMMADCLSKRAQERLLQHIDSSKSEQESTGSTS